MGSTSVFSDKTAIVTGGASGIGRALCRELGRRGAVIVAADINFEDAQKAAAEIVAEGGRAHATLLDVTRAEDVQKLVDTTVLEHGRLNYMFNNAGIAIAGEVRDMNLDHWRRIIDINLWGVIYGTLAAYQVMVKQGSGHIVNTASTAGLVAFPTGAPYATTKHAVVGLSNSLRAEGADLGVKVSVVCPGFIRTGIFEAATVVNADKQKAIAKAEPLSMDVSGAALKILSGVEKNRQIINFPFHAALLWRLYRIHPVLVAPMLRRAVKDFRAIRREP